MTHQEQFRSSIRYKLLRLLWVYPKRLSVWAGKKLAEYSMAADKKDNFR